MNAFSATQLIYTGVGLSPQTENIKKKGANARSEFHTEGNHFHSLHSIHGLSSDAAENRCPAYSAHMPTNALSTALEGHVGHKEAAWLTAPPYIRSQGLAIVYIFFYLFP